MPFATPSYRALSSCNVYQQIISLRKSRLCPERGYKWIESRLSVVSWLSFPKYNAYVLTGLLARRANRPTRKPAWPIQWLFWRVNRNEAEMIEWRPVILDRPICWRSSSSEIVPFHPRTPTTFFCPDRLNLLRISGDFHDFFFGLRTSLGEAKHG